MRNNLFVRPLFTAPRYTQLNQPPRLFSVTTFSMRQQRSNAQTLSFGIKDTCKSFVWVNCWQCEDSLTFPHSTNIQLSWHARNLVKIISLWLTLLWTYISVLQWRHNERDGVSNHRRLDGLHNRLFRSRSQKTSKLCVTGLCEGNSPVTGEFPAQMASNAENVLISWRHNGHVLGHVSFPIIPRNPE